MENIERNFVSHLSVLGPLLVSARTTTRTQDLHRTLSSWKVSAAEASSLIPSSTMSQSDRGGIQALLAAEQDAQHIVANARAAKTARLRQAKEEAEREVAQYRAQREAEFRKKLQETSGDSGTNVKRLEGETEEKIKRLSAEAAKVAPEVTALLMKYVITVRN